MPAYYRRGLQWTRTSYIPASTGGWNPDANWWEMADTQAPTLENLLIRAGKIVARQPLISIGALALPGTPGAPVLPVGYAFGDTVLPSTSPSGVMNIWSKNDSTTQYIDPWSAPLLNAAAANLAQGSLVQYQVPLDSDGRSPGAHTLASRDVVGGPRWINFSGLLYGISYDAVAAAVHDVNNTYNIPPLNLLTMPVVQTSNNGLTAGTGVNGEWLVGLGVDDATVGTVAWTNPNNATTNNHGTPATVSFTGQQASHYLKLTTNAAHAVPAGATITGVKVQVDGSASGPGIYDAATRLVKGGVIGGNDHMDTQSIQWQSGYRLGGTEPVPTLRSYGGPNDLWGLTLTPADVNATNFGVAISAQGLTGTNATLSVAGVWITVYYVVDNLSVPSVLANAPHGAFDLKGYLSRVWLLGGVDTPGALTVHEPATLFYTNPIGTPGAGSPLGNNSTDWKDPITGFTNKLTMDSNFEDFGVGLALVPNAMLIFRRNSVWRLTGSTSQSFVLKLLSREVGCIDARSIVEVDKGVFWMSMRGLMFTDGSTIRNVSGSVQQDLLAAISQAQTILQQGNVTTKATAYATAALTSKGTVVVTIGYGSTVFGGIPTLTTNWSGMYDPTTGAWVRISSHLWNQQLPVLMVARAVKQQLYSVGNVTGQVHNVVQFENYGSVDAAIWGTSFMGPVLPGTITLEDVDKTATLYNSHQYTRRAIPFAWSTKLIPFDVSHKNLITKRWFLDYVMVSQSTKKLQLTFDLYSANGNGLQIGELNAAAILATTGTPGFLNFGSAAAIQQGALPVIGRVSSEYSREIDDSVFAVTTLNSSNSTTSSVHQGINSDGLTNGVLEFYGVGLDYMITRDADGTDVGYS